MFSWSCKCLGLLVIGGWVYMGSKVLVLELGDCFGETSLILAGQTACSWRDFVDLNYSRMSKAIVLCFTYRTPRGFLTSLSSFCLSLN